MVIGSYAALNSLKSTVWELDLLCVLQTHWKGNTLFTAAFKMPKPPKTCAGRWAARSAIFFKRSLLDWPVPQFVWYPTYIIPSVDWKCPEETSPKQYWHWLNWHHTVMSGASLYNAKCKGLWDTCCKFVGTVQKRCNTEGSRWNISLKSSLSLVPSAVFMKNNTNPLSQLVLLVMGQNPLLME